MSAPNRLSAERLRHLLTYRPESGCFFWNVESRSGFKQSAINHMPGDEAGTLRKSDGRIVIRVDGRTYLRYRLAWLWVTGKWPTREIDHMDGDPSNDRISNLREVSRVLNQQNIRSPVKTKKSSQFLGVFANKPGRAAPWRAAIQDRGRQIYLGAFMTEMEAHEAYLSAKRRLHEGCTI
ncbi:HNH endonuclease [Pseudomonas aestusnigri]|uniref:HNH endonuclease signature motif containing protein n=1 Tax=Halopseudomonas aestusnigri TaxID=857252 RepID=UPI001D1862A1|nr:HNH endonuclease signature motif containing protein [Halopseudomonas aestusnigri]MCC4260797.1 HNH endonuclease [Halopseudomonas aestusnigri]